MQRITFGLIAVLSLVAPSYGSNDVALRVDQGTFTLEDLSFDGCFRIKGGAAINKTGREWESVTFQLIPIDRRGNSILPALGLFITAYGSSPGRSTRLWWNRRSEQGLRVLREMGFALSRWEVRFDAAVQASPSPR